ncbi:hypothetical protein EMPS_01812 [Entomortierella parvispora]|uniref:Uncharacterized protein n=1 Tax=Entomortierella parvispora TaxID=205924 RepID=A0A9P3H3L2_9FUNG|nr:hypothetical protein EMPS_01812 [Entomortierella parvispora]
MPSVISPTTTSDLTFVADDSLYFNGPSSTNTPSNNDIQSLKNEARRRKQLWSDPDDEFSVPIHTESPLVTKGPIDMSSFLLNYRTMHRSIEIMTPPVSQSTTTGAAAPSPSSSIHPSVPDGPFYIHHRSRIACSPLSTVLSCPHVSCLHHKRPLHATGSSTSCQQYSGFLVEDESPRDFHFHTTQEKRAPSSSSSIHTTPRHSRTSSSSSAKTTMAAAPAFVQQTLLDGHISAIGQWLQQQQQQ